MTTVAFASHLFQCLRPRVSGQTPHVHQPDNSGNPRRSPGFTLSSRDELESSSASTFCAIRMLLKFGIRLDLYLYVLAGMQDEPASRIDSSLRKAINGQRRPMVLNFTYDCVENRHVPPSAFNSGCRMFANGGTQQGRKCLE